jgi:glutaredoxin
VTVPRITLFARPGCHLCDDAREVISRVAADLAVAWEERDITQSAADLREYWEKIPVTFVDGVQHDFWRVSEDRLRMALLSPGGATPRTPRCPPRAGLIAETAIVSGPPGPDESREVTPLASGGVSLSP